VSLIQHDQTGRRRGRLPPSLETDVPERLRRLPPAELSDEQKEVYDAITAGPRSGGPSPVSLTDSEGGLHGPFNAMLLSPPLGLTREQDTESRTVVLNHAVPGAIRETANKQAEIS
jgi:hypothetical protein